MVKKKKVGILFGGKSAEHEVSLQSARNIIDALDKEKYEITLIGIDKLGNWQLYDENIWYGMTGDFMLPPSHTQVAILPGSQGSGLLSLAEGKVLSLDVIFPVLHGTYGEDGTVQGLLKLAGIPFVGADVLGSAVGMDKDVMKRLLQEAGIPIAKYKVYYSWEQAQINFAEVAAVLGLPLFIKPANLGSSVGVSKVNNEQEFIKAIEEAFQFDNKVIIEENIAGREVECAVLGNEAPQASAVGEIVVQQDFYSYTAKYLDEQGAILHIPAKISAEMTERIQQLAVKTFKVLCCEGMGRVDMFLTRDNNLIVNEINTIPGFTKISMYPKLWEVSGLAYGRLIDRLIELALARQQRDEKLCTLRPSER